MQPSGEVGRFEVDGQPSPPADRYRYPAWMNSMIRIFILPIVLLTFIGCQQTATISSDTADGSNFVAATELTQSMIGNWGTDGETALIVREENGKVEFATPDNDTWRMEISDAKIVGDTVTFVQKNYLHDGSDHPFNGVACNSIAKLVDRDTLELGMTTKDSPDLGAEKLKRVK